MSGAAADAGTIGSAGGVPRTTDLSRVGRAAAFSVFGLSAIYAVVLAVGFWSISGTGEPIGDPMFTLLELLILLLLLPIVLLEAAIAARAATRVAKLFGGAGMVFAGLLAGTTGIVHFLILTLSRQPAFATAPWHDAVFAFRWPSFAYGVDILSWDIFFPLMALCAAAAIERQGLGRPIRWLLVASAALAFGDLAGVTTGDMGLRNIGIVGYAIVYPVAALLLAVQFGRPVPTGRR